MDITKSLLSRKKAMARLLCLLLALILLPLSAMAEIGVILIDEEGNVDYEALPGMPETLEELAELAPEFGPVVTPEPTATPRPGMLRAAAVNPPNYPGVSLKYGSKGAAVTAIQNRLKELGYFGGTVTGNYLEMTVSYVKTFQQKNGLGADGIVGPQTWAKLFFDPNVISVGGSGTTTPPASTAKYFITIDCVNQIVTVYSKDSSGKYGKVEKRFICSTGTASYPTPIGSFTLNGRTARWCYFPEWGSHAQYWTRINSSIAFHSVIYSKPQTNALVLSSYTNLGSPASHGCIRLLVADAKWIYDNVGAGTVVETFKGKADPEGTQALKPGPIEAATNLPKATPQPTALPVYNSQELPPQPFRTLKVGLSGRDVFWLQSRLKEIGLYAGSVTGGYWEGTRDAVKAYQKANGLTADGMAGTKTQTVLYAYLLNAPRLVNQLLVPEVTPILEATPIPTPILTPEPTPELTPIPTPEPTPIPTPGAVG
ncbi:hypothetical protein AGMMS49992_03370 [Clostridia bacterium]|nr:hypothetical protein AGMMS49992_03370 [Clostridia bacterium]